MTSESIGRLRVAIPRSTESRHLLPKCGVRIGREIVIESRRRTERKRKEESIVNESVPHTHSTRSFSRLVGTAIIFKDPKLKESSFSSFLLFSAASSSVWY